MSGATKQISPEVSAEGGSELPLIRPLPPQFSPDDRSQKLYEVLQWMLYHLTEQCRLEAHDWEVLRDVRADLINEIVRAGLYEVFDVPTL